MFQLGHFGRARPRGNHPLQMERLPLDGQDVTHEDQEVILSVWQCDEAIWHMWKPGGALEGPTSGFWMLEMHKKGQRLPQKGMTSHFFSYYVIFLAVNVKTM
jgi:hypothetical protein